MAHAARRDGDGSCGSIDKGRGKRYNGGNAAQDSCKNLDLSRSVSLYANGQEVPGIDGLLGALDRFLYDGEAGDSLVTMLTAMKYSILPALFLLMIPAGSTICAAILGCRKDLKKTLGRVALYVSVILFSVFILYPFFVMFITAFRSNAETTDMYFLHILPEKWIFSNLQDTLNRGFCGI